LFAVHVFTVVCLLRVLAVAYTLGHGHLLLLRVLLQLRDHAPEGKLPWLDGGFKDWEHFHGTSFGSYNLWVARDELIPQVRGLGGRCSGSWAVVWSKRLRHMLCTKLQEEWPVTT
jgi:hypothetical protein